MFMAKLSDINGNRWITIDQITNALNQCNHSVIQTAKHLDITNHTMRKILKENPIIRVGGIGCKIWNNEEEPELSDLELLTHKIAKIKCELDCTVDQALAIINFERGI